MKPLRIVKVISTFHPVVGGGEKQAERLAAELVRRGHEVTVLTRRVRADLPASELLHGMRVVRVEGHGRWGYSVAMLRWLAQHRREIDVLHVHQSNSPLVVGAMAARLWGLPLVCTPMTHTPELAWLAGGGADRLRRWLYGAAERWIAKSEEIATALERYAPGRVLTISNGVDATVFAPDQRPAGALPTAIFVGRLTRPKRVDLLLEAWQRVGPTARLLIVGDGDLRSQWEAEAAARQLSQVQFLGNRSDIPALLREADLFVLASDLEGMPNALLEAMSSGLPAVASAVGAVPQLLAEGAGSAVPPGDARALATELLRLINDPELRADMGRRAREQILAAYSLKAVAERVAEVYAGIAHGGE